MNYYHKLADIQSCINLAIVNHDTEALKQLREEMDKHRAEHDIVVDNKGHPHDKL